jgi:KaiC/GvpD/RAD55 family RecA-like ATPase
MNIPVEVPGLSTLIPELDEGRMVVVESGADAAKSFFVRRISLTAGREGMPVTFVTSRDEAEVRSFFERQGEIPAHSEASFQVLERDRLDDLQEFAQPGGLLAIDSFSFLTLDVHAVKLASALRGLRTTCQENGMIALLATDRGMFESRAEAVATHLADGFLQFHAREGAEGVQRFLRIPKWMDGKFIDRNIYYEFDGRRLAIDLRSRVL